MTIPRLQAYVQYWDKIPPQQTQLRIIAHLLGYEEPEKVSLIDSTEIESVSEFIPVNQLSESEFDQVLAQFKIPTQSH